MAKTLKERRDEDARKRLQQGQTTQPIQPGADTQPVVQPQGVAPQIEWFDETPDWLKTPSELYGPVGQQNTGNDVITPTPAQTAPQRQQNANGLPSIPQTAAYDPDSNAAYQSAMAALQQAQGNRPVYQDNGYGAQLDSIAAQILNREPFRYDLGADPMYRMYRDQAMETGRLAMQDTMGRAAALTGGYGSTYAQQLGSQAYDAYLRSLNEQIPALQAQARAAYDAEWDRLAQQYSLLANAEDRRYGRYRDEMSDYWQNVSFAQDQANLAYNRGYQQWADTQDQQWQAYNAELAQDQLLYGRSEDSYNRLMQLITNTGYSPSAEELQAAGMSPQEAASWQDYYRIQQELAAAKSAGSYSSGRRSGGGSGSDSGDGGLDDENGNWMSPMELAYADGVRDRGTAMAWLVGHGYAGSSAEAERYTLGWDDFVVQKDAEAEQAQNAAAEAEADREFEERLQRVREQNSGLIDDVIMDLAQINDADTRLKRLKDLYFSGRFGTPSENPEALQGVADYIYIAIYDAVMGGYDPDKAYTHLWNGTYTQRNGRFR